MKSRDVQKSNLYAQAIFELAKEQENPEKVWNELSAFESAQETYPKLHMFLNLPFFSLEDKYALLDKVFGEKFSKVTISFLKTLIHKRLFFLLEHILANYQKMLDEHLGQLRISVTTAVSLSTKQKAVFREDFEASLKQKVVIESDVDESIIGGAVIRFGDSTIDGSVQKQIKMMHKELTSPHHLEKLIKA